MSQYRRRNLIRLSQRQPRRADGDDFAAQRSRQGYRAPSTFIVSTKEEAKERAKALARTLGLKTYGIANKTRTATHPAT